MLFTAQAKKERTNAVSYTHLAILTYLEILKEHFYAFEASVDGVQFATARGWEDLSELLLTYEQLGIHPDREVIGQYIQLPRIAKDFANYLELYAKYRQVCLLYTSRCV